MEDKNKPYFQSAQYYDFIYLNKKDGIDYKKSVDDFLYLANIMLGRPLTLLLDVGCGTGNHAIMFAQQGITVTGIDLSADQLKIAHEKARKNNLNINFIHGNMTNVQINELYDSAASFFSGFCYLLTDKEVLDFLNNMYKVVKPNGFLFFEFWHTLGILPDSKHYDIIEDNNTTLYRFNKTEFDVSTGIVKMPMQHLIIKENQVIDEFTEEHYLRTYTVPHLLSLIALTSWRVAEIYSGYYKDNKEKRAPKWNDFRLYAVLKHL